MDILECLMKVGFTRHESILYLTLCKEGELSGYEASKVSGIPRSNAYLALAGLVEKGGAFKIDSDVVKYSAVPAKELTANMKREISNVLRYIEKNIPQRHQLSNPYITVSGKNHIINKMKNMITNAQERIYLSIPSKEIEYLLDEIHECKNRNIKIVIITSPPFDIEGITTYITDKQSGQIRLIVDGCLVLTGELREEDCSCLYSKNMTLVSLIKDSLTNEIELIRIKNNNLS